MKHSELVCAPVPKRNERELLFLCCVVDMIGMIRRLVFLLKFWMHRSQNYPYKYLCVAVASAVT